MAQHQAEPKLNLDLKRTTNSTFECSCVLLASSLQSTASQITILTLPPPLAQSPTRLSPGRFKIQFPTNHPIFKFRVVSTSAHNAVLCITILDCIPRLHPEGRCRAR